MEDDNGAAYFRLLPNGMCDWPNGVPPQKYRLPVDDILDELRGRKSPTLRDPSDYQDPALRHGGPHRYLREVIALYRPGGLFRLTHRSDAKSRYKEQLRKIRDARAALGICLSGSLMPPPAEYIEFGANFETGMALYAAIYTKLVDALDALGELEAINEGMLQHYAPPSGGRPTDWRAKFITHMGVIWHDLTGTKPSVAADSFFGRFVGAAWESSGDDEAFIAWDGLIRRHALAAWRT